MTGNETSTEPVSQREKLKKLISSESFDELMQVVGNKGWIAIWCCFAILLIGIVWGFLGSIPIKVMGNGISMTLKGPHVIVSQIQGTVLETNVVLGQFVEKGELIVKLDNPTLELEIRQKRGGLTNKENELQALISRVEEEKTGRRASILKEMESAILGRKTTENNLDFYQKDLQAKERLEKKGIVPAQSVQEARAKLEQAKIDIQMYQATLTPSKSRFRSLLPSGRDSIKIGRGGCHS
ncbi:MAG: biotin/lipoyl-binding protein [Chlamydiales bacterium]